MESYFGHSIGLAGWFVRAIQVISAVIVLGPTAWAVEGTKTVTVIYSLVIASLTLAILVLAPDGVFSYLWLTSFIFLALDFNRTNCRRNRWNGEVNCSRSYTAEAFSFIAFFTSLLGFAFEIIFSYYTKLRPVRELEESYPEECVASNLNAAGLIKVAFIGLPLLYVPP